MRTVKLHAAHPVLGNAVFDLVFSPGKLEDVKYVSGTDAMKSMAESLKTAKFDIEFPNESPVKLLRQGVLDCRAISGCNIVLLPPDSVH